MKLTLCPKVLAFFSLSLERLEEIITYLLTRRRLFRLYVENAIKSTTGHFIWLASPLFTFTLNHP